MANPFVKAWNYLMALFDSKIEEHADPKVQIEQAIQDAQRAENELAVTKAEAKKKIVSARAEAEAYELKTRALSPLVIQQMFIDKWDGKLPVYGQVPTMFKSVH